MRNSIHQKQGKLTTNNVILQPHEQHTVNFLLMQGFDIELIQPSSRPNSKKADFWMLGLAWEMKSPKGKGKYLIRDTLKTAACQSPNIILDLRRIKINQTKAIKDTQKYFSETKNTEHLLIITQNQLLDFSKKV